MDNNTIGNIQRYKEECSELFKKVFRKKTALEVHCCYSLFINNCFEKKCGLSLACSLFTVPTISLQCSEFVHDPALCDVVPK